MSALLLLAAVGAPDPVDLVDSNVGDTEGSPTVASCTITVNRDGSVSFAGNTSDAGYDWYIPGSGGTPGDNYEVKLDVDSGDAPTTGTTGSWLALTANRSWIWTTGAGPASLSAGCTLSIRNASTGVVADTCTLTVLAESVV